jgi:hypothetical protein
MEAYKKLSKPTAINAAAVAREVRSVIRSRVHKRSTISFDNVELAYVVKKGADGAVFGWMSGPIIAEIGAQLKWMDAAVACATGPPSVIIIDLTIEDKVVIQKWCKHHTFEVTHFKNAQAYFYLCDEFTNNCAVTRLAFAEEEEPAPESFLETYTVDTSKFREGAVNAWVGLTAGPDAWIRKQRPSDPHKIIVFAGETFWEHTTELPLCVFADARYGRAALRTMICRLVGVVDDTRIQELADPQFTFEMRGTRTCAFANVRENDCARRVFWVFPASEPCEIDFVVDERGLISAFHDNMSPTLAARLCPVLAHIGRALA